LAGGLNFGQSVTNLGDGILQVGQIGQEIQATFDELSGIFSQPQAGEPNKGNSVNINVGVSVGGQGGAAGNGGAANATNTGSIATYGAQSDGIYAQSVGGGGGSGGAASSTDKAANDTPVQASLGVGGQGGAGGAGGRVTITNGTGGTILTQGVAAFGIFAQSVGGGGGEGSLAATVNGSLQSLGVGIGGNGGSGGDGGVVTVTTGDGTSGSTNTTTGKHGIAIFAQSVGGGGGLVRTMTTDQTIRKKIHATLNQDCALTRRIDSSAGLGGFQSCAQRQPARVFQHYPPPKSVIETGLVIAPQRTSANWAVIPTAFRSDSLAISLSMVS
jgi:hypothetical protein